MKANTALVMVVVPGPSRSERADSEDAAAPARQKPSEPPPVYPERADIHEFSSTYQPVLVPCIGALQHKYLVTLRHSTFLRSFSAASISALMVLSNLFSSFGFFAFAGAEVGNNNGSLEGDIYLAQEHQVCRQVPLRSFSKTVKLGFVLYLFLSASLQPVCQSSL